MAITYQQIDDEYERIVACFEGKCAQSFPPEGKATMTAFMQHTNGLPVRARCMHCGELLSVTEHGTAWIVRCPCGRSKDTLWGRRR